MKCDGRSHAAVNWKYMKKGKVLNEVFWAICFHYELFEKIEHIHYACVSVTQVSGKGANGVKIWKCISLHTFNFSFTVFTWPFIIIHDYLFPLTHGVTKVTRMHPFIISAANIISFTCRDPELSMKRQQAHRVNCIAALTLSNPRSSSRRIHKNPTDPEKVILQISLFQFWQHRNYYNRIRTLAQKEKPAM